MITIDSIEDVLNDSKRVHVFDTNFFIPLLNFEIPIFENGNMTNIKHFISDFISLGVMNPKEQKKICRYIPIAKRNIVHFYSKIVELCEKSLIKIPSEVYTELTCSIGNYVKARRTGRNNKNDFLGKIRRINSKKEYIFANSKQTAQVYLLKDKCARKEQIAAQIIKDKGLVFDLSSTSGYNTIYNRLIKDNTVGENDVKIFSQALALSKNQEKPLTLWPNNGDMVNLAMRIIVYEPKLSERILINGQYPKVEYIQKFP